MKKLTVSRWIAGFLMLAILAACEFSPLNPASTPTPLPSSTATPAPGPTATQPPAQTDTPSPTIALSTATTTSLPGPVPLCLPGATAAADGWITCRSQRFGFEVSYPPDSTLDKVREDYARIDLPFMPGTNLAEKYLEITASQGAESCTSPLAQGFDPAAVPTQQVSIQALGFIRQEGKEGAAGNHYQWVSYSTTRGDECVNLSFVLHSANPENFATPPAEFDQQEEAKVFDQVVATFQWVQ